MTEKRRAQGDKILLCFPVGLPLPEFFSEYQPGPRIHLAGCRFWMCYQLRGTIPAKSVPKERYLQTNRESLWAGTGITGQIFYERCAEPRVAEKVEAHFRGSNANTSEMIGTDLQSLE